MKKVHVFPFHTVPVVSDVDAGSGTNDEWVGAGRGQSDSRGDGDGARKLKPVGALSVLITVSIEM